MSAFPRAGAAGRPLIPRIRGMMPGDLPAVAAVERASYAFPWREGIFRDCLRVGYLCRVAEMDGAIGGYGVLALGKDEAHLLNLCVRADLRGRGLGRRMLLGLLAGREVRRNNRRGCSLQARADQDESAHRRYSAVCRLDGE